MIPIDTIFILKTLRTKYFHIVKTKLYVCFVDFHKTFDGGFSLFYLICTQIYNTLVIVQVPIAHLTLLIKGLDNGSSLFNKFVDVKDCINKSHSDSVNRLDTSFNHLLYADDLVLLCEYTSGLQSCLGVLWMNESLTSVTKILLFFLGKNSTNVYVYRGVSLIEIVD